MGLVKGRTSILILAGLALICLVAVAAIGWGYRDRIGEIDLQAWADRIAEKGPVPYFAAMSLLPAAWFPVSPFLLGAGALFSTPVAIGGVAFSLAFNMAFCWLISGKLFRPAFERLVARFGYTVPELGRRNMLQVALLMRITPGVPFPLQNYLLGLARMPFGWYMLVSLPPALGYGVCFVLFGDALLEGNVKMILFAVSLFVVISLVVRTLRNRMRIKKLEEEIK